MASKSTSSVATLHVRCENGKPTIVTREGSGAARVFVGLLLEEALSRFTPIDTVRSGAGTIHIKESTIDELLATYLGSSSDDNQKFTVEGELSSVAVQSIAKQSIDATRK